MKRSDKLLILSLSIFFAAVFIIQRFLTGTFFWSIIGIALLSPLLIFLTSKKGVQKIIGEYPHLEYGKFINGLRWGLGAVLMLILSLFILLDQLSKPEVDYKNFIVFIVVPILLPIALGVMRIPDVTKKTKTGLIRVIKKLFSSTILFVIFIPLFTITNKLRIDINSTPDLIHSESIFRGFIGWSMAFCFYAGLFLFIFAVIDFALVIKELAIRKPRKAKKARQHSV
jgi:hypothetical protein